VRRRATPPTEALDAVLAALDGVIVAHDGARAADVLAFARHLRDSVAERFGVRLALEPAVWE